MSRIPGKNSLSYQHTRKRLPFLSLSHIICELKAVCSKQFTKYLLNTYLLNELVFLLNISQICKSHLLKFFFRTLRSLPEVALKQAHRKGHRESLPCGPTQFGLIAPTLSKLTCGPPQMQVQPSLVLAEMLFLPGACLRGEKE